MFRREIRGKRGLWIGDSYGRNGVRAARAIMGGMGVMGVMGCESHGRFLGKRGCLGKR